MSFRLFVYWCTLCGGWAAAAGWGLGFWIVRGDSLGGTGIKGMFLGMLIALALGLVDALWVYSLRQFGHVIRASWFVRRSAASAAWSEASWANSCSTGRTWWSC